MDDLFLKLFNMSIAASWGIAAVIILRFFLRKAPKWLRCALWAIVAIRLVCPVSLESMFSLIPSAEVISPTVVQYTVAPTVDTGIPVINNALNPIIQNSFTPTPGDSVNPLHIWTFAAGIIWVIGLIILLGHALLSYLHIRREVAASIRLYDNIYICDTVRSPFILGLIRPRIYLPSDTEDAQMKYILAHENAHLKRKDHWWKPFGYVLLTIYWFNPLVWIAYILLCRDIELACDEKAVHDLNLDGRKAYSEALLNCSMKRRMIMACPIAFGEVGVKERVKTVLNYKKPAFWVMVVAIAACIAVGVCFLTNPKMNDSLEEMISRHKAELTEQIGSLISEAEAVRYSITDWKLVVEQIEGNRADCYFDANWTSTRKAEDDPMIQGMYQAARNLSDETQKAYALEIADGWLTEMQSWQGEEYLQHPIVIMQEDQTLALYYPYVMDGVETLIPLEEFVENNWTEDSEKRYQDGIDIIQEALNNVDTTKESAMTTDGSDDVDSETQTDNQSHYYFIKGTSDNSLFLDEVEWVTDPNRAAALGLQEEDMPNGFNVYNEEDSQIKYSFAEECSFTILDWYNNYEVTTVDQQTFLDTIDQRTGALSAIPFIIEIADGKIVSVTEQYVP